MKKHLLVLLATLSMFTILAMPASAAIGLSAGGATISNGGKTATTSVTFTCAFTGSYEVNGSLLQGSGRLIASGYSDTSGSCYEGETVTAFVTINSQGSAFKAGPAQLIASVSLEAQELVCYQYYDEYYGWQEYCYYQTTNSDGGQLNSVVRLKK